MNLAGAMYVDCRAIDQKHAWLDSSGEIAPDGYDVPPGRQHGDRDVCTFEGLRCCSNDPDAPRPRRIASGRHRVDSLHHIASLHKIAGHRPAHVTEADEPYRSGHGDFLPHTPEQSGISALASCRNK